MPRARNLKPGFFANDVLAECSFETRLCFAGLWTLADREGRLEDRPKKIKGELFRFDSVEVEPMLEQLSKRGFIVRYEVNGSRYIQIVEFVKHQNPHHREADSTFPPPPSTEKSPGLDIDGKRGEPGARDLFDDGEASEKPQASPIPAVLIPDSPFLIPDSPFLIPGTPPDRGGAGGNPSSSPNTVSTPTAAPAPASPAPPPLPPDPPPVAPTAKGSRTKRPTAATAQRQRRVPPDWLVSVALQHWAREKVPGLDIRLETELFRNWEFKDGKLDWDATWRTWMLKAFKELGQRGPPGRTNGHHVNRQEALERSNAAALQTWLDNAPRTPKQPLEEFP